MKVARIARSTNKKQFKPTGKKYKKSNQKALKTTKPNQFTDIEKITVRLAFTFL